MQSKKSNRFLIFEQEEISRIFPNNKSFDLEYRKHIGYGSSGAYDNRTKLGGIWSYLKKCTELNKKGYKNLNFCNGGDDDVLVVDTLNKEYGFFEDNNPTEEEMKKAKTLTELWEMH